MPTFRKKPAVIVATQWFRNGDHPQDGSTPIETGGGNTQARLTEGKVVRFFMATAIPGGRFCSECGNIMQHHGMMGEGALNPEEIVHPGDYIVTDIKGRYYPMRPEEFEGRFEPYDPMPHPAPTISDPGKVQT